MSAAAVSRWTRLFVVASAAWFVVWQVGVALGAGRRFAVTVGLHGFVFHVVFGKAYSLVPSYFDRELAFPHAPAVHLPLAAGGTAGMAVDAAGLGRGAGGPAWRAAAVGPAWGDAGAVAWALGVAVLVGALGYSVRDNLAGRETGTAEAKAERRPVDRLSNAFVPVALLYVLLGAALPAVDALAVDPPIPLPATGPPVTHLLAAGGAALLLFAVGFRLLPRFLVATPRRTLVAVVLPSGALGPLLLATDFLGGWPFLLGAGLQALALVGFAVAYLDLFRRSDRRRIGLYALCVAAGSAAVLALLGLHVATGGLDAGIADAHARVALLGFFGLAIVGVSYQFYPPAVASSRWVDDRTAATAVALLAVGLAVDVGGLVAGVDPAVAAGRWVAVAGAIVHAMVLLAVFDERGL